MSTTTSNLTSLSTTLAPIVGQANAANAAGGTLVGTSIGGGSQGTVQTYGPAGNTLYSVNPAGMTVANGPDTTATGLGAQAGTAGTPAPGATAYGAYASANAPAATAIGYRAVANYTGGVAVGNNARAVADPATAVGDSALASGNDSVAVGASAQATATRAVAIGAGSVADQPNTVSVGAPGSERRITNVAPGINPTDAVNVAQLRDSSRIAYSGIAMSFAMSGSVMPPLEAGDKAIGVGLGTYRGYGAVALTFRSVNSSGDSAWGMGVTTTGRDWGAQLGVGFKWK